ncbi:hypothetical protein BDP27DRAFT_1370992 [Rhodocollybia butyracea]|uniref:Uncharacterized protein n=1 Tax=Rhodocollybia butyracea TaxID=206335 RepID=A0A9P5PD11_9AGAR|nr:hypothetical protein BDP27DRAFT_1370992 [Rhodocollybia butyracea]
MAAFGWGLQNSVAAAEAIPVQNSNYNLVYSSLSFMYGVDDGRHLQRRPFNVQRPRRPDTTGLKKRGSGNIFDSEMHGRGYGYGVAAHMKHINAYNSTDAPGTSPPTLPRVTLPVSLTDHLPYLAYKDKEGAGRVGVERPTLPLGYSYPNSYPYPSSSTLQSRDPSLVVMDEKSSRAHEPAAGTITLVLGVIYLYDAESQSGTIIIYFKP